MTDMTIDEIDDLLNESRIGRLCMCGEDRQPYAIPIPFCWHEGELYIRLPINGRKGTILTQNDSVCFEVDSFTETLDEYASVLIEGRLLPVVDLREKLRVKQANDRKYDRLRNGQRPGHGRSTALVELPMRKIAVQRISGRKRSKPSMALATANF
jgi:nitroimidazol reductase NimA-like FMN-containing flavoprotein (pyridoxamine 5'-phosphate oxidase superfamily)